MPGVVLVVDDRARPRRALAHELADAGYDVVEAQDGVEGWRLFGQHRPDVVISDVVMPKFSGTNLAGELRERHPELPLLFVSGFLGNEELDLKREFPGAQFMAKPLRLKSLLVTVDMLLHPGRKASEDPKVPEAPAKT